MSTKRFKAVCAIALAAATMASAQSEGPPPSPWLFLGLRVAVAGEITQPAGFNAAIQSFYPSPNAYFPVYSQIGLNLAEQVSIAESGYRLSFSELVLLSGLDQNFALPLLRLMVGVLMPFGLEAGLGPQLELTKTSSAIGVAPSLIYSIGWRFSIGAVTLPVTLVVDPLPPERHVRVSLMAGVDYGLSPSRPPTPKTPFNY